MPFNIFQPPTDDLLAWFKGNFIIRVKDAYRTDEISHLQDIEAHWSDHQNREAPTTDNVESADADSANADSAFADEISLCSHQTDSPSCYVCNGVAMVREKTMLHDNQFFPIT